MKSVGGSLYTQRSGDQRALVSARSIDRNAKTFNFRFSSKPRSSALTATSIRESQFLSAFVEPHDVPVASDNLVKEDADCLMERFAKAVTEVKSTRISRASSKSSGDIRRTSAKTTSTSGNAIASSVSERHLSKATFGIGWLRKSTSCLVTRTASIDAIELDRRPSEDILIMVQEQKRKLDERIRERKHEIRNAKRQVEFLTRQLDAMKKTHPRQKAFMRAVDELDATAIASYKLDWKLVVLNEERERLHRRVFAHKSAQEALESSGDKKPTIEDDTWRRDLEIFSKLAYAGLLKGRDDNIDLE